MAVKLTTGLLFAGFLGLLHPAPAQSATSGVPPAPSPAPSPRLSKPMPVVRPSPGAEPAAPAPSVIIQLDGAPPARREGAAGTPWVPYEQPGSAPAEPSVRAPHRVPPRVVRASRSVAAAEMAAMFVSEQYAAGAVGFAPILTPRYGLSGRHALGPDTFLQASLQYLQYTLQDQQLAASRHQRDDFTLRLEGGYRPPSAGTAVGLGVWSRLVSVANSMPSPLTTPFLTAPAHLLLGPSLMAQTRHAPAPEVELSLDLLALPFVAALGEPSVTAISPLFGFGVHPGVRLRPSQQFSVALSYQLDVLRGYASGYSQLRQGPALRVDWRF